MKKLLPLAITLFISVATQAQQKEGTITYERKINVWKRITNEELKATIPEFRTSKHVLFFNDTSSLFKMLPDDDAPDPFEGAGGGGGRRFFRMSGADGGDLYKNFSTSLAIQANELGGKNFLIVDTIKKAPWKITTDTKEILGLKCRKAVRQMPAPQARSFRFSRNGNTDTAKPAAPTASSQPQMEVIAWFAEGILSPAGPESYGQLPGVILEMNIDNGTIVYNPLDIKKTVDAKEIKEPKKGKLVTQAEYRNLMMQIMQNQGGGAIRMNNGN